MATSPLDRLRRICLAFPGASDVPAWGTSTFRCPKIFAMYAQPTDQKHSGGRPGVWIKAAPGNQEFMVRDKPERFYVPPYVGPSGWVGIYLDAGVDWSEVALLVEEAWRLMAPKRAVKAFDAGAPPPAPPRTASARTKVPRKATPRRDTPPARRPSTSADEAARRPARKK